MKPMLLIGIFSILVFSAIPAPTSGWKLEHNEYWTSVKTTGTAEINNLRVDAVLKLACNKNRAMLNFEIADFDKVQKVFDVRIFEGPSAPARDLPLTIIELEGSKPVFSISVPQNGFISVENRFVFEAGGSQPSGASLVQLFRRMAEEGNFLRIRIQSYRDPRQFINSVFPLNDSRAAITALVSACP